MAAGMAHNARWFSSLHTASESSNFLINVFIYYFIYNYYFVYVQNGLPNSGFFFLLKTWSLCVALAVLEVNYCRPGWP